MADQLFTLTDWYQAQRDWPGLDPAPISCDVTPTEVEAGAPCLLEARFTATDDLPPGAAIYFEYPYGWGKWLGRCYGSRGPVPRSNGLAPGMGVTIDAIGPDDACWDDELEVMDCDRFLVLRLTVPEVGLTSGETCKLIFGAPPGAPARAQKWAQRAVFATGVDMGEGTIAPARPQPALDVTGGPADRLSIHAPATPTPGEPFSVHVQARDRVYENPAESHSGVASLHIAGHISISDRPHLADGRATVTAEMGEGIGWLTALDTATGIAGAGDPIGAGFLIDGDRIFFGDIHGQVRDSIGTGTHEEYLGWARDVERLDFCSPANHYGGREHADERTWARCVDATNAFNAPGEFATLVAYECAPSDGHRNVYCRGDSGRLFLHGGLTDPGARVMPELVDRLTEAGSDVFIVPHHPNFCSPVDWTKWGGRYQRLVEIASQWGVSEEGPVHSVRHALNMGHRLGIIAGSDTHMGTPGRAHQDWGQPCGLAAVIAPELTREAIWDALHGRRCYGVFGERMLIDFRLDGQMMGSETRGSGPRTMATRVATRTPIASLEIIRNGEVARAFDDATGDRLAEMKWTDDASLESLLLKPSFDEIAPFCYYYLRVKTVTGNMGWSSPIWVT